MHLKEPLCPTPTEQVKVSPRTYRFATSLTIMLETIMLEYYYFVLHHTNTISSLIIYSSNTSPSQPLQTQTFGTKEAIPVISLPNINAWIS
mmetsp:Transcript_29235/g.49841  ORF Transcript_29235/g.49841 Transcript_29235/m.49841 type:complete len:91 (-) Transcript_29235:956-1228(-)